MSLDTLHPQHPADRTADATTTPPGASIPDADEVTRITTPPVRPPMASGGRLAQLWRGPAGRPGWERPALIGLLSATAILYLWGLGDSGWANSFYSAAAQAGSESWKAWFFGSSDAASSITVDKPPLAIMVMGLSVRIFGLSSWSILVPEALMGVGSVALLYATVRRTMRSAPAGLIAGAVLAVTPVASLMFRFNNPDALLVLLLIGAAAALLRAIEITWSPVAASTSGPAPSADDAARFQQSQLVQWARWTGWSRWTRIRTHATTWLVLCGALLGFAFLTKMLQAFLVLPAFALAYLLMAHRPFLIRMRDLLLGLVSLIVAGGWWVAIVSLWPADDRPYIGGSQHNSILELILGYNGLGRLDGSESGSVGGGAVAGGNWGATGLLRLMGSDIGGQVGWLLPASLVLLVVAGWFAWRSRSIGAVSGLVVFGGWLLVTGLTFSEMAGIFHPYYTVALAPAIGGIAGIGSVVLWRHRARLLAGLGLGVVVATAAVTSFILLERTPDFVPWLRWFVLVVGLGTAALFPGARLLPKRTAGVVAAAGLVAVLAGPTAYAIDTAQTPHSGAIPSAGPSVPGSFAPGGVPGGAPGGAPGGVRGAAPGAFPGTGTGGFPGTGTGGFQGTGTGGFQGNGTGGFTGGRTGGSTAGGLLDGSTPSAAIVKLLDANASDYTWVAATVGSNSAAGYQLATRHSVMPIGGFNGTDPSPTLAQFKADVAAGRIHYFIASGGGIGGGGVQAGGGTASTSSAITAWVEAHFTANTVGGVSLYDLSGGAR